MRRGNPLHLHEEIMLLALRDREGTVFSGTMYGFAIGGAVLAELLMEKRIDVEAVKTKKFARVLSQVSVEWHRVDPKPGDLPMDRVKRG